MDLLSSKEAQDISMMLCSAMKNTGFLPNYRGAFPYVVEIIVQGDDTVRRTYDLMKSNPDASMHVEEIAAAWCAFMGMGAVAAWNSDWGNFKNTSIVDYLSAKRGFDYIDEYVLDIIGLGFGTIEGNQLTDFIRDSVDQLLESSYSLKSILLGMFYFGMVYEMTLLGMH